MKKQFIIFGFIIFCVITKTFAQKGFQFIGENQKKEQISFKLINNIIIFPLEINGKKLSFILDTGVNKTILFNLFKNDSVSLNDTKKVKLQGLGAGESVDAIISKKNKFRINDLISNNETIYVILKDFFDLSSKMDTTIHGIIGYDLLKDLVVRINYKTKKITFYNPKIYTYPKCEKCETFPLEFNHNKPYINAKVQLDTIGKTVLGVKLLIDSGGSDAVWLFEGSKKDIKTPKNFFNDILGEGLSGTVFGDRSRIPKILLGSFEIKNPTVSFLDTVSTYRARSFKKRNGSIGGNILKRFKVWIDYPNKKMTLKKNGSFKSGFNYNMSGLDVVYSGKQLVKEKVINTYKDSYNDNSQKNNTVSFVTSYAFKFKHSYKINKVVENSPAFKAGLLKDDLIVSINGKPAYEYTLGEITSKFQEQDKKKIKILVKRNGVKMKFEFRLEKKI